MPLSPEEQAILNNLERDFENEFESGFESDAHPELPDTVRVALGTTDRQLLTPQDLIEVLDTVYQNRDLDAGQLAFLNRLIEESIESEDPTVHLQKRIISMDDENNPGVVLSLYEFDHPDRHQGDEA